MKSIDPYPSVIIKSNLAIALYLLPSSRRKDALLFYKLCQSMDECIDQASLKEQEKEHFLKTAFDPLASIIDRYDINKDHLSEMIHGMEMDLSIKRYLTFDHLRLYAWRVASTVGLVCTKLFGASGFYSNEYAEALGLALQFTNILRDVAEDAARGRIYLPLEDLARFNVTENEILSSTGSPQMIHLFDHQGKRALSFFAKSEIAWKKMSSQERLAMAPARLMEAIYRTLLQKMDQDRYDLFHQRYRVMIFTKIALVIPILWGNVYEIMKQWLATIPLVNNENQVKHKRLGL